MDTTRPSGTAPEDAGPSPQQEQAHQPDTGLVCLLILARFYGVPADGAQLRHLFGQSTKPFGDADLLRAATHLGFKAGLVDSDWSRLSVIQLPAIARRKDGRYLVLAKADDEKVLVQDPGEQRPRSEEHTSELQSPYDLVCRLLLEKRRSG